MRTCRSIFAHYIESHHRSHVLPELWVLRSVHEIAQFVHTPKRIQHSRNLSEVSLCDGVVLDSALDISSSFEVLSIQMVSGTQMNSVPCLCNRNRPLDRKSTRLNSSH